MVHFHLEECGTMVDYGIILTVDVVGDRLRPHLPQRWIRRQLECIEEEDGREAVEWSDNAPGYHRKYVGVLCQADFDALVEQCWLTSEDVQTMGSLGVSWSGSGFGLAPAVSFRATDTGVDCNAYVTPLVNKPTEPTPMFPAFDDELQDDGDFVNGLWECIRQWTVDRYEEWEEAEDREPPGNPLADLVNHVRNARIERTRPNCEGEGCDKPARHTIPLDNEIGGNVARLCYNCAMKRGKNNG
jgi:hypothetical protein